MVLGNHKKKIIAAALYAIMVLVFSCEKPAVINCSECASSEPVKAKLIIRLDEKYNVEVNIYEGNVEDSLLYRSIFINQSEQFYEYVPLNRKYTVTAAYMADGIRYIAVNSVTPRVMLDEEICEEPCWYVYNNKVDMRLRYMKYGRN